MVHQIKEKKLLILVIGLVFCLSMAPGADDARGGAEPFIGEISWFAGSWAPRLWAFCDGQLLSIADYTTLFAVIECTYGGDCITTFALPDLRGRVPVHVRRGPGLSHRYLGEKGGYEHGSVTDVVTVRVEPADEDSQTAVSVISSDSQLRHNTMQPYLGINCIIALEGIWPSRDW
jgi:microcystin-dependent protein